MNPLKLVIDTNVLVSALLKPDGLQRKVLDIALTPPAEWYVTHEINLEYGEVLFRPRFGFNPLDIGLFLDMLMERTKIVTPRFDFNVCADPDDNKFIECAIACDADFLITGNLKHYPPQINFGIALLVEGEPITDVNQTQIVNGRMFLAEINK